MINAQYETTNVSKLHDAVDMTSQVYTAFMHSCDVLLQAFYRYRLTSRRCFPRAGCLPWQLPPLTPLRLPLVCACTPAIHSGTLVERVLGCESLQLTNQMLGCESLQLTSSISSQNDASAFKL